MNVKEIINRGLQATLSQEEALFIIREFIKEKRGREIDIAPPRTVIQFQLMHHMSHIAKEWFFTNPSKSS